MRANMERLGKICGGGLVVAAILVVVVLLMTWVTGGDDGIWARIPSWDWKQIAIVSASIVGLAIIAK